MPIHHHVAQRWGPPLAAAAALVLVLLWIFQDSDKSLEIRQPGADHVPEPSTSDRGNPVLEGILTRGNGLPADLPGAWPQFRGASRDGTTDATGLSSDWSTKPPRTLWSIEVGEGYAGPAVAEGCVYLMDYDREAQRDVLRCLSLEDGREIWNFSYPVRIKRNHGMTRTVPSVQSGAVVAIGPKCHVLCCDARTGTLRWTVDLTQEFGTAVPEWYTGQCPLIDGDRVILAPGGPEALLVALRLSDGELIWKTPNPDAWRMTHSSIMPMNSGAHRQFVYCANKGVVGVSAEDGSLLWKTSEWKISIATVPSPCVLDNNRLFFSGGYNAGSLMLHLAHTNDTYAASTLFRLDAETFGATQHSPVFFSNHLYGVRADGRLVCLDANGNLTWESDPADTYGLGPFLLAGDLIYAMDDDGLLRLIRARPDRYEPRGHIQALEGRESWAPMALAGTRLLVRDFTRMTCLDVGGN